MTYGYNWAIKHTKGTERIKNRCPGTPKSLYPGEFFVGDKADIKYKATGEYRPPKTGEYYLSGAFIAAHQAPNDLTTSYWIAKPVETVTCPCRNGTGKTEKNN